MGLSFSMCICACLSVCVCVVCVCVCVCVTIVNAGHTLAKIKNVKNDDFDICHRMASLQNILSESKKFKMLKSPKR